MTARAAAHPGVAVRRSRWRSLRARPWWPWARRGATLAFFAIIALLLAAEARRVDWGEVLASIRAMPVSALIGAGMLAAASHMMVSSFDLFGRAYTGHKLRKRSVVTVNFISYAFNLNLGALIGGFALRYRLYTRLGLKLGTITRVLGFSLLTNWLGYALLAGASLLWWPLALPPQWSAYGTALQFAGLLLIVAPFAYIAICGLMRRRHVRVGRHKLKIPPLRIAVLQLFISSVNWMAIAGVIYLLLRREIAYPEVLGVLLTAAIAGVITHVPAGLGVFEAVFVALLSAQMPKEQLLAALLAYRAIYYLLPLLAAAALYVAFEAQMKTDPTRVPHPDTRTA